MPTIAYIGAIQIRIYYDDHGIPHFHAVCPDFDFKIAINDFSIISGNGRLRARDLAAIRTPRYGHGDKSTRISYIPIGSSPPTANLCKT